MTRTSGASARNDDFASAALLALVVRAVGERAPHLLPPELRRIDATRRAARGRRAMILRALVVGLVALALAMPAHAWGADGHRITGEIAWRALDAKTKEAVRAILGCEQLADAAAWADTKAVRGNPRYDWIDPLHYVNVDPKAKRVRAGRDCRCVVGAIEVQRDRLRDPRATKEEKREALRLVAHFVGDVHQPLHVSHTDGRGGTRTDVVFQGRKMTLHRLWDTALVRRRLDEVGRRRGGRWRAFAHSVADRTPSEVRARWQAERDPRVWAEESLALARRYTFDVRDEAPLGNPYYQETKAAVEERLAQAGFRLAALLTDVFAPAPPVR